jgi:hypothetical protein
LRLSVTDRLRAYLAAEAARLPSPRELWKRLEERVKKKADER